ncbi:hypothetical protein ACWCOV_12830 [Kribbella sp. NPDC002412]
MSDAEHSEADQVSHDPHEAEALETVIITAVVTAAVVPFVQTLVQRAAEDSYDAVRNLLRKRFREARVASKEPAGPVRPLLVVKNDDPGLDVNLYAQPDMDNAAIRALAELDLGAAAHGRSKKLRVYWDGQAGRWQIDGD